MTGAWYGQWLGGVAWAGWWTLKNDDKQFLVTELATQSFAHAMAKLDTLGSRIIYFRDRLGWNQTRLWKALGMTQSRLSRLESNTLQPYHDELERIALVLGVPLCYFDTLRHIIVTQDSQHYKVLDVPMPGPCGCGNGAQGGAEHRV